MGVHGWKSTLQSFATVAGISLATCLNAQDGLAPVLSAGSYETYSSYEAADESAEASDRSQDDSLDVIDIPSVFEDNLSDVKPVSFHQTACDSGSSCPTVCCLPKWAHRTGGFGEVLYLSAGNSDLIYANEQTGPVAAASPTGPLGISNIGEHVGFRAGFSIARSNCSSINASYTRWDGATTSILDATGNNVINSQVSHPSVATTGAASLDAIARQSANFQFADVYFRRVCRSNACGS